MRTVKGRYPSRQWDAIWSINKSELRILLPSGSAKATGVHLGTSNQNNTVGGLRPLPFLWSGGEDSYNSRGNEQ